MLPMKRRSIGVLVVLIAMITVGLVWSFIEQPLVEFITLGIIPGTNISIGLGHIFIGSFMLMTLITIARKMRDQR